jgi:hypothetical protein
VGIKGMGMRRSLMLHLLKPVLHLTESRGTALKSVGNRQNNARFTKGICMVGEQAKAKGATPTMVAPTRCTTYVE